MTTGNWRDLSLVCVACVLVSQLVLVTGNGMTKLPPPNSNLNVYALPVGQGDCTIIQCPADRYGNSNVPTLLTVIDMGAIGKRYMKADDVKNFLGLQKGYVEVVTISHPHEDHHNYIPEVLPQSARELPELRGVFIGCAKKDYSGYDDNPQTTNGWLSVVEQRGMLNFSEGRRCTTRCPIIKICGGTVILKMLGANLANLQNLGTTCSDPNSNSLIWRLEYGHNFKLLLPGDFQDTSKGNKQGLQRLLIDEWGEHGGIQADFYKLAHHGAYQGGSNKTTRANKDHFLQAVHPKYAFSSSAAPPNNYNHPHCGLYRRLQLLGSIHTGDNVSGTLQKTYTCGYNQRLYRHNPNNWGIYSTAPSSDMPTIVHIATDGARSWIEPIPYN